MSDLIKRIADYFTNDYQGDDKTAPTMEITVNDLRYIANMNVERCRAESELRNIKYNKCKDCAGCVQCKADEANAIQKYIDKVVEELGTDSSVKLYGSQNSDNYMIPVKRAIEIVKQGGVSDDVCEWESDYGFISDKYKRETGCGYTFYDLHHAVPFKYCPYCGKKIKVVD